MMVQYGSGIDKDLLDGDNNNGEDTGDGVNDDDDDDDEDDEGDEDGDVDKDGSISGSGSTISGFISDVVLSNGSAARGDWFCSFVVVDIDDGVDVDKDIAGVDFLIFRLFSSNIFRISFVASIPPIRGISKSMKMTL